jgi:hypothetical protein
LVGCSDRQAENPYTGDMENALNALKWQDYETALGESNAFLQRVPHSAPAKIIRETAAWRTLALMEKDEIILSKGKVTINSNGFSVTDLPESEDAKFHLTGYTIEVAYDSNYIEQDFNVSRFYLSQIRLYWKYPNGHTEFEYVIFYPDQIKGEDLRGTMNSWYGGDRLSDETHAEFVDYLQEEWVPSMNEVFAQLKQKHQFAPEYIGFDMWNQPVGEE